MNKNKLLFFVCVASVAVLIVLPFISQQFLITMLIRIMYYGLLAIAFSFLAGQLGLFSLMVPVAFALSGYAIAILESRHILRFPFSTIVGIIFSLLISALFGLIINRSKGTYFLMLTLVLGQLVWALVLQWASLTGGTNGIIGIQTPALFGLKGKMASEEFYYSLLFVFLICLISLYAIIHSSYGLKLRGIRESESRMVMLGYNVSFLKWSAFMISSFLSAISGAFFVYYLGLINPDPISLSAATEVMICSIFGGIESLLGAILGTGIVKSMEITLSGITQRYLIIEGIMFLLVIIFIPKGLMGLSTQIKNHKK